MSSTCNNSPLFFTTFLHILILHLRVEEKTSVERGNITCSKCHSSLPEECGLSPLLAKAAENPASLSQLKAPPCPRKFGELEGASPEFSH